MSLRLAGVGCCLDKAHRIIVLILPTVGLLLRRSQFRYRLGVQRVLLCAALFERGLFSFQRCLFRSKPFQLGPSSKFMD